MSSKTFKRTLLSYALNHPDFLTALSEAALEIRTEAAAASNEATLESAFERILYAEFKDIGLRFNVAKEVLIETRRHITKGRADTRLGGVVIEYKHSTKLRTERHILAATQQLEAYIESISQKETTDVQGYLTDGLKILGVLASGGKIVSRSAFQAVDADTLLLFAKSLVSLTLTALTPKNLIADFCGTDCSGLIFSAARIFFDTLVSQTTPKTSMLRAEWEELFRLSHDDTSQQKRILDRRSALSKIIDRAINSTEHEYVALFALHGAYSIVLKLMAFRVLGDVYLDEVTQDFGGLAHATSEELRRFCERLEDGEVFRELGILNLLEGDFFSWYADKTQWTPAIETAVKGYLNILARYESVRSIFDSSVAVDLFRELYESTIPQVVRGNFGEFYTPFWLAETVIDAARKPGHKWRLLDPCCGSGTFLVAAILRVRSEGHSFERALSEIIGRVVGIDLNPLSVLTARVNYFINIADLLQGCDELVIPVFLGDAAAVPEIRDISGVQCVVYRLNTLKTPVDIVLPTSVVKNLSKFCKLMRRVEEAVNERDAASAANELIGAIPKAQRLSTLTAKIEDFTKELVNLEARGWNGIWARIISNYLATANLGKFAMVVGNPPWIDWKNLPAGYRDRVKALCIERGLFSGAGRTGGINLNICALISYVSASNWLAADGIMALLMPRELTYQASYEGWRKTGAGKHHKLIELHDWTAAGHPFEPVREDFLTFVFAPSSSITGGVVAVKEFKLKSKAACKVSHGIMPPGMIVTRAVAGQIIPGGTAYTFAKSIDELNRFALIAGECHYIGREGIEFYPQELLLLKYIKPGPRKGVVWVENMQFSKSKHPIPKRRRLLETKYLYPLVKGPSIGSFSLHETDIIVPFPYERSDPRRPLDRGSLKKQSPLLLRYYLESESVIKAQTPFSDKIRGQDAGEFYGLARTGAYSFADVYVAFRDNTKWCSTVTTSKRMPWGARKRFVFQNHSVSICESNSGNLITEDEAHFICAILNAPIVEEFISRTSDQRSYKIRPPVFVPEYDAADPLHNRLADISRRAHAGLIAVEDARAEAAGVYIRLARRDRQVLNAAQPLRDAEP